MLVSRTPPGSNHEQVTPEQGSAQGLVTRGAVTAMHRLFPRPVSCKTRLTVKDRGRTVITVVCILTPHHHQAGTAVLTCREVGCEQCSIHQMRQLVLSTTVGGPQTLLPRRLQQSCIHARPCSSRRQQAVLNFTHRPAPDAKQGSPKRGDLQVNMADQMILPQQHPTTTLPHCRCAVYKYD